MKAVELAKGIYKTGVNLHGDLLFEGLWPMPDGASINAYVIKADKIALIDCVEDLGDLPSEYETALESVGVTPLDVDYLVVNHMEPDHTSWIDKYVHKNPAITIVCTAKTKGLLKSFYNISDNVLIVKNGDVLDLGQGKVLEFYETPNVHWPETMVTYEKQSGILFSCDAFGSFGSVTDEASFDDRLSEERLRFYEREGLRYYANIIASFSSFVVKAINSIDKLDIKMIAPSHGIIWRNNPRRIIDLYRKLAEYATTGGENELCLVWGSMYGNTERSLQAIRDAALESGMNLHEHRVPQTESGFILADVWRSKGLIFAMPSYEYKMFPPVAHAIDGLERKHMFNKEVFRIGSFGWVGGAEKEFRAATEKMKWNVGESVEWAGRPTEDDLERVKAGVRELAERVRGRK